LTWRPSGAERIGSGLIGAILIAASLSAISPADEGGSPKPEAVRSAVDKALPLILNATEEYPRSRDCFSCHPQAVPVLALATAKGRGFAVEPEAIAGPVEHTEADLRCALESYRKGAGQGGGVTRAGYALFTLEVGPRLFGQLVAPATGPVPRPPGPGQGRGALSLAIRNPVMFA
jgi:hypothetical protein